MKNEAKRSQAKIAAIDFDTTRDSDKALEVANDVIKKQMAETLEITRNTVLQVFIGFYRFFKMLTYIIGLSEMKE